MSDEPVSGRSDHDERTPEEVETTRAEHREGRPAEHREGRDTRDESREFEEGRYLYCVVDVDEAVAFTAEGIEGEPVSLLVEDGIGAVVQPADSVYDSDDVTRVRRWLLAHQEVVDAAGDAFGTPLPFRFDTILKGDDETVLRWLRSEYRELADALEWLSGRWEYRIEVRWDETAVRESLRDEDPQLRELAARVEEAESGTGYLLESQLEQRLAERLAERAEQLEDDLVAGIEPYAVEVRRSDADARLLSADEETDLETAVQLSVFAVDDHEEQIGEALEPLADRPGYEVRYTGPWPPYTHAPDVGGDDS